MVERQLDKFFAEEGYVGIPSNLPEFTIYFQMEPTYVNVFHVVFYRSDLYISKDQYLHIKEKIRNLFLEKGISQIHILSLIVCNDGNKARQLCADDAMCWMIDPYENRLMIFEDQVSNFYGMKDKLEYFLAHLEGDEQTESIPKAETGKHKVPIITTVLVVMNVFIFLLCTFTGDLLYNIGAISIIGFLEKHEYYRIVTSLFLHWDINHLVSNMIVLYYLGEVVEEHYGLVRYGILYLTAGVCGNILSLVYEFCSKTVMFSAGASGAIFGVIGALFLLVIIHKGHLRQISLGRLMFMLAYSLYSGFVGSNINNAAHIGGFLSGAAIASIYQFCNRMKTRKKVQSV
jgi:Uncharacterized membrane protein (homolog of Drosophila rhomboid)